MAEYARFSLDAMGEIYCLLLIKIHSQSNKFAMGVCVDNSVTCD